MWFKKFNGICLLCKGTGVIPREDDPKKLRLCPLCHGLGK